MALSKKNFIDEMAKRCEITKVDATEMYEDVFGVLHDLLCEGNDVAIPDIGKFEIKERGERTGRNPNTGESITIPAKKAPAFKASKNLKEVVSQL